MPNYYVIKDGELYHFGVKGMKWGVRKAIQYAGNVGRRIGSGLTKSGRQISKVSNRLAKVGSNKQVNQPTIPDTERQAKIAKAKKAAKIGAAAAATVLAAYGAYKINKFVREANVQHHADLISKTLEPYYSQGHAFGTGPLATIEARNLARSGTATVAKGFNKNDSFGKAVRNVVGDAIKRKTNRY